MLGGCGAVVGLAGGQDAPSPSRPAPSDGEQNGDDQPAPPEEGSIRDLLAEKVGPFSLEETGEFPESIEKGASESLKAAYSSSGGDVLHTISAFSDEETAGSFKEAFVAALQESGYQVADEGQVGENGSFTRLDNPTQGVSLVAWSNGKLFCTAESGLAQGQDVAAAAFYNAVEY